VSKALPVFKGGYQLPEKQVVLRNCEVINPGDINTYLARDGFQALGKAREITPEQVIEEIKASGLRGRGGAGFPCGLKWGLARESQGDEKYVICNADEGEVGTFKDRYILGKDPFTLIEAMAIAGYAMIPWQRLSVRCRKGDFWATLILTSVKALGHISVVKSLH